MVLNIRIITVEAQPFAHRAAISVLVNIFTKELIAITLASGVTVVAAALEHDPAACLKSLFLFFLLKEGKYREALGKWESALLLMPDRAILHEQKAQILLELGETWKALKAATRATELEPSWDEAWVTLGRAQLNYGEPDSAIESLDRALAIKPDSTEARNDRQAALHHIQRRKQLQTSGLSMNQNRFAVVDKTESA
ncbi:putative tetratricopeptide repeat protein 33-like isoform X2 [Capsicum annuum]|nr:putative tetratricopeptide repeat protein 33-like isoform X2 [Capsicum annuum]